MKHAKKSNHYENTAYNHCRSVCHVLTGLSHGDKRPNYHHNPIDCPCLRKDNGKADSEGD